MGRSNSGVSGDSLTESVDLTMNNSDDNNSLYVEGEKVLALHGGVWYQAKVHILTKITLAIIFFKFLFLM